MYDLKIRLNGIDKVKNFVEIINTFAEDISFHLFEGKSMIDARSIMGIFSLDLTKEMILKVHTEDKESFIDVLNAIDKFLV